LEKISKKVKLNQSYILVLKNIFLEKKIKSVQIENILAIPYQKIARKKNKKNWCAVFGPGGGFFGVGTSELIVIGAVAWLVLGPKRLYQLARDIGKISGELKNVAEEARQTFQQAIDLENIENETKVKDGKLKTTKEEDDSKNRKVKKSYMKELDNLVVTDIALNEKKKDEKP